MDNRRIEGILTELEEIKEKIDEIRDLVYWSVGLHFLTALMVLVGLIVFR